MKNTAHKNLFRLFLAIAAFGFFAVSPAQAQNTKESASGQGSLAASTPSGDNRKRQFSFSAHRNADGSVKGNAVLHNPEYTVSNGKKYQLQIDIVCMKIVGNYAIFSGTTKRTNDPTLVDVASFIVQDNGEPGKNSDQISRVFFYDDDPATTGDPQVCQNTNPTDYPLEKIESGNIQVRSK